MSVLTLESLEGNGKVESPSTGSTGKSSVTIGFNGKPIPRRTHRYTRQSGVSMGTCTGCTAMLASFDKVVDDKLICGTCGHANEYDKAKYAEAAAATVVSVHNSDDAKKKYESSKVITLADLV